MKPGALFCRVLLLSSLAGFAIGWIVLGLRFPAAVVVMLLILGARYLREGRGAVSDAFGCARFADAVDIRSAGLTGGTGGLILGRTDESHVPAKGRSCIGLLTAPLTRSDAACREFLAAHLGVHRKSGELIRLRDHVHVLTCAPTGRGKSVSCLLPTLQSYAGSCVVNDPKGELFRLTSEHRRRRFGHRIVLLDPFGVGGRRSNGFNVLDLIPEDSPILMDLCRRLANALVVRTGEEREPHWNDMAELVLTAFIAFIACHVKTENRHLGMLRQIVSSRASYTEAIKIMKASDACGGMLKRAGEQLEWLVDRELGSVMTSVQRFTAWMDSPEVEAVFSRSSFRPSEDLRGGKVTVYLCLPSDMLSSHAAIIRLWISSLLMALARDGGDERRKVLFLLDEAGHIGHIQALEDAVTMLRGAGVRLWFFFQSVSQLAKTYADRAHIFLDNMDTQQFFGINAIDSAEAISKRLGDETISNVSQQTSRSYSYSASVGDGGHYQPGQHSTSTSVTVSEVGRNLLRPEEITRLSEDAVIIFHRNNPPILARRVKHYADPEFKGGGTGKAIGMGCAGGLAAVFFSLVSVLFVAFALGITAQATGPSGGGYMFPGPSAPQEPTFDNPFNDWKPDAATLARMRAEYHQRANSVPPTSPLYRHDPAPSQYHTPFPYEPPSASPQASGAMGGRTRRGRR